MIRKTIAMGVALFLYLGMQAQNNTTDQNVWIKRIRMVETNECIDSITCYTEVIVEVNPNVIPDSSLMFISIGTVIGGSDIYYESFPVSDRMPVNTIVSATDAGAWQFNLGKYIVTNDFYVDMGIETAPGE